MEIPVGDNTSRPCILEGMVRDYFKDGYYFIELYENGQWKQLVKTPEENVSGDV